MVTTALAEPLTSFRQFGGPADDTATDVATDPTGTVFVVGAVSGSLEGSPSVNHSFVRKYAAGINEGWTRRFDAGSATAVAASSPGSIYVLGQGVVEGRAGALLRKLDRQGEVIWSRHFSVNHHETVAESVAVDPTGHAYVVGRTRYGPLGYGRESFLRKYDPSGLEMWTRTLRLDFPSWRVHPFVDANDVVVDARGNAYVTGNARGTLGSGDVGNGPWDVFVRKYGADGDVAWSRQFGVRSETGWETAAAGSVAVRGAGGVYVVGGTYGALSGQVSSGAGDAFIRGYDDAGNQIWTRQVGTSESESATGVTEDARGNAHVAGSTSGALPGELSAGSIDAFVGTFDAEGVALAIRQFGTSAGDEANAVVARTGQALYVVGSTGGTLPGQASQGERDAYLAKLPQQDNQPSRI